MKLFFVEGIGHHAIVLASDEKEAEILARKAHLRMRTAWILEFYMAALESGSSSELWS